MGSLQQHNFKQPLHWWNALFLGCTLMLGGAASYAAPKTVHMVTIEAMQFSPAILEVNVGDTVVWKNHDPYPHTATSNKNEFNSGNILPDHNWKFVAKKRGTFPYSCALHETMKGTLVVK